MKNDIRIAADSTIDQHDFQANLVQHCHFVEVAGSEGIKLLVLSELSPTGYHREQARARSVVMTSPSLEALRRASASADFVGERSSGQWTGHVIPSLSSKMHKQA